VNNLCFNLRENHCIADVVYQANFFYDYGSDIRFVLSSVISFTHFHTSFWSNGNFFPNSKDRSSTGGEISINL